MPTKPELTAERLRELFRYDPSTGEFTRRVGTTNPDGCVMVSVDGRQYRANRLAVLYMTGAWPSPDQVVDHINRVRTDDRWDNLRVCTPAENNSNADAPRMHVDVAKAVALVDDGLPIREAAKQAGVGVTTVTRARKRLGKPELPKGRRAHI